MKRLLLVAAYALLLATVAWGASLVPGPPERFKDWPLIADKVEMCPGGRLLTVQAYAEEPGFTYPGLIVISDKDGPFVWLYYTDRDELAGVRWAVWFDGAVYRQGTFGELKELGPSACSVPRPAPTKAF